MFLKFNARDKLPMFQAEAEGLSAIAGTGAIRVPRVLGTGVDDRYGAFLLKLFHENALGGIVTDENTQMLKSGRPAPGLYAIGDNTRGIMMPGRVGADYIDSAISSLIFAFCSGYIAGEEAGKTRS